MAHPLTQHPPNLLGFGAPARTPLTFGFGQPAHPAHAPHAAHAHPHAAHAAHGTHGTHGTPPYARPPAFGALVSSGTAFPSAPSSGGAPGPLRRAFTTPRPAAPSAGPSGLASPAPPPSLSSLASLKRPRRTSSSSSGSSPSASPSPLPSSPLSPRRTDDAGAGSFSAISLAASGARRVRPKRARPAARAAPDAPAPPPELDAGVLLAALPPTAHLPILLGLLEADPALAAAVLARLPRPDLGSCLAELDRAAARVARAAGGAEPLDGQAAMRRWARAEPPLVAFCNTATTYLRFFTRAPPSSSPDAQTDARTLFSLLHALTSHVLALLALVPSQSAGAASPDPSLASLAPLPSLAATSTPAADPPPAARPLLDLANLTLSGWQLWLSALADDVNARGAMYPQSTVLAWADGLAALAAPPPAPAPAPAPRSTPQSPAAGSHSGAGAAGGPGFGAFPTFPSSTTFPAFAPTFASWAAPPPAVQQQEHALVVGFRDAVGPIKHKFAADLGWLVGRAF